MRTIKRLLFGFAVAIAIAASIQLDLGPDDIDAAQDVADEVMALEGKQ